MHKLQLGYGTSELDCICGIVTAACRLDGQHRANVPNSRVYSKPVMPLGLKWRLQQFQPVAHPCSLQEDICNVPERSARADCHLAGTIQTKSDMPLGFVYSRASVRRLCVVRPAQAT